MCDIICDQAMDICVPEERMEEGEDYSKHIPSKDPCFIYQRRGRYSISH